MKRAHYLRRERHRNRWRRLRRRRVRFKRYDPSKVTVSFNGVEMLGYTDVTFIQSRGPIIVSDEIAIERTKSPSFGIQTMLRSFTLSPVERSVTHEGYSPEEIKTILTAAKVVFSRDTYRATLPELERFVFALHDEIWSQLKSVT